MKLNVKSISFEAVDLACGRHISSCHIGLDKKVRKGVIDNSYFLDAKTAEKCFENSFDEYTLEEIESCLKKDFIGEKTIMCYGDEDEVIGYLYQNDIKKETPCSDWYIALEFHGNTYVNYKTGLPFDVKTLFPINEENA